MATVPKKQRRPPPNGLVLYDVDWQTYSRMLRIFAERPGYHLTYDRGVLEIMSSLLQHENPAELLGRFVVVLTEELGLTIKAAGSTTLRRRKRLRGLEPDRSWWIASEPRMRHKDTLDLRVDPPPDLAIEVDTTSSSLNRMGIYAKLRVPEVWRVDGGGITFQVLGADGECTSSLESRAFPGLKPGDLLPFLALRKTMDENELVRQFRDWIRQHLVGKGKP